MKKESTQIKSLKHLKHLQIETAVSPLEARKHSQGASLMKIMESTYITSIHQSKLHA